MSLLPSLMALSLLMGAPSDPSRPRTNVEPRAEAPRADDESGRLLLGLQLGGMPRLTVGGEWTRQKPFYVQVQISEFFFVRVVSYRPPGAWKRWD